MEMELLGPFKGVARSSHPKGEEEGHYMQTAVGAMESKVGKRASGWYRLRFM